MYMEKFKKISGKKYFKFREFIGYQFLLRHYTDVRWDARVVVSPEQINTRMSHESAYPVGY